MATMHNEDLTESDVDELEQLGVTVPGEIRTAVNLLASLREAIQAKRSDQYVRLAVRQATPDQAADLVEQSIAEATATANPPAWIEPLTETAITRVNAAVRSHRAELFDSVITAAKPKFKAVNTAVAKVDAATPQAKPSALSREQLDAFHAATTALQDAAPYLAAALRFTGRGTDVAAGTMAMLHLLDGANPESFREAFSVEFGGFGGRQARQRHLTDVEDVVYLASVGITLAVGRGFADSAKAAKAAVGVGDTTKPTAYVHGWGEAAVL